MYTDVIEKYIVRTRYMAWLSPDIANCVKFIEFNALSEAVSLKSSIRILHDQNSKFSLNFIKFRHFSKKSRVGYYNSLFPDANRKYVDIYVCFQ